MTLIAWKNGIVAEIFRSLNQPDAKVAWFKMGDWSTDDDHRLIHDCWSGHIFLSGTVGQLKEMKEWAGEVFQSMDDPITSPLCGSTEGEYAFIAVDVDRIYLASSRGIERLDHSKPYAVGTKADYAISLMESGFDARISALKCIDSENDKDAFVGSVSVHWEQ